MADAEIGIFGGSGFYSFVEGLVEHTMHTPYGAPSAAVSLGSLGGRRVAFIPRHGPHHEIPPHAINYRANLWAFKELGVTRVLAPSAAGSLQPHVHPGDVVICDQLIDRTSGRPADLSTTARCRCTCRSRIRTAPSSVRSPATPHGRRGCGSSTAGPWS